jgi:lipoprotein-releasing system ATP-binding protein
MNETQFVLQCSNLHKKFMIEKKGASELYVLRGIDLTISKGEIVAIVGASGSGKSTLLHVLGGLDRPMEGKVFWSGKDIFSLSDESLAVLRGRSVGFVFQFHHLLPEFTALENIMIPQMIVGKGLREAETRARDLLRRVNVIDRDHHRPGELSGGEQQRVAVARALANNPQIILADEPSGNLDSENSRQLHDLLIELNRTEQQTFVIVTHNEQFADQSHRVLRMADGRLEVVRSG